MHLEEVLLNTTLLFENLSLLDLSPPKYLGWVGISFVFIRLNGSSPNC